ncbi:hypothetical protein [Carbonactinospora thermoautotrophica]|uniref:hypothetical protein n=1 Tax=Carbonactinospora thermoautotrophica TaxID=1469144 RepID=UPI00226E8023|nr:hypothetical protein [Carbonactinospora thermoautotrophica]
MAVDLGDAGMALRRAQAIDVARAHAQRRQPDEAVAALEQAEELTPEQVREHKVVHQLVTDLLTIQDPPGPRLQALARRVGVLSP